MSHRLVAFALAASGALGMGSCSTPDEVAPPDPLVEDPDETDPTFLPTLPPGGATPELVAEQVLRTVTDTIGVVLAPADSGCVLREIVADVDVDALARLGLAGLIVDQPLIIQGQLFGAFDACVSAERYAELLGPTLVIAGADEPGATCVFRALRSRLGFAGLFRYASGNTGELDPDEGLQSQVAAIYVECDVDPATLAPPTTPPPTTTTIEGESRTVSTSTSSAPVTTAPPVTPLPTLPTTSVVRSSTTVRRTPTTRSGSATTISP
jgi:hypothetical protein